MDYQFKISGLKVCCGILLVISLGISSADDTNVTSGKNDQQRSTWLDRLSEAIPGAAGVFQSLSPDCNKHPQTPGGIPLRQSDFINWAEILKFPKLWKAEPSHPTDVVALVNWAYIHNYTVRASGFMHSWSPITLATDTSPCQKTLLVDTTKHLTRMFVTYENDTHPAKVTVQTGASWEKLLTYLENNDYGIFSFPAVGQMSLGGTLAVGAHGTGLPRKITRVADGFRTGSISNLILSLDAVVWDPLTESYVIKTFKREDEDTRAFLVHLGRAFVTSVTLLIDRNYNLRCQSITDIKADVLFASERAQHGQTLGSYVELYDRVEAQFFPYTQKTWLKLWTNEETKGAMSTKITKPYPYNHGNEVARPVDQLIALLASGVTRLTPIISRLTYEIGSNGVALTRTGDVWGPSKNSLLYYHHLAHKFISLGYTVLTTRGNIQKVVHKCFRFFNNLSEEMVRDGKYPMNQPVEFRITGLDKTEPLMYRNQTMGSMRPPSLSFLSEVEGHPEYDVAVFLGLHYFPGTPDVEIFMRDWESFLFSTFNGKYGTARVEWAKTWGFDLKGPWANSTVYRDILPQTFGSEWNWAINKLNQYDPHHVYSNGFLEKLMAPV